MCGVRGTGQGSLQPCIWKVRPIDIAKRYSIDPKRSASCEPVAIATKTQLQASWCLADSRNSPIQGIRKAFVFEVGEEKIVGVVDRSFTPSGCRSQI